MRRIAAFPGDNQVRAQRDDGLEIETGIAADAGNPFGRLGVVAVRDRTDQIIARASGEKHLRGMRREAHDAPCRLRERDRLSEIVLDADVRVRVHPRQARRCQYS